MSTQTKTVNTNRYSLIKKRKKMHTCWGKFDEVNWGCESWFEEPNVGDEIREYLNNGEIVELFPEEEEPYYEFKTDFLNDPLELIKLYGYLNQVEVGGWTFEFDEETVYDANGKEYYLECAYVDPRFDNIMVELKAEIDRWLDASDDEVDWVWNRDKWEAYKKEWYSTHGIHKYGRTPYAV